MNMKDFKFKRHSLFSEQEDGGIIEWAHLALKFRDEAHFRDWASVVMLEVSDLSWADYCSTYTLSRSNLLELSQFARETILSECRRQVQEKADELLEAIEAMGQRDDIIV